MRTLFITRKYPPSTGGMESLSYHLTTNFREPKKILAMRKVHQAHLVWFLPYAMLYLLLFGWRYDVIHLSDLVLACLGWVGKIVWRKPVVITIHGLDFTYENGTTILQRVFRVYMNLVRLLPTFDHLYSNSSNTKRLAAEHGFEAVTAIPLGVLPPKSQKQTTRDDLTAIVPPVSPNSVYLFTAGRLVKRKGVSWFLENVFLHLPPETMYVITGVANWRSADKEPQRVKDFIAKHQLENRVKLLGRVENQTLATFFSQCDIFVMANIRIKDDVEGFGIVAGEAAWSGMAVVASNIEGIPDAIQHEKNGLLLESENAEQWKSALTRLIERPEERKSLGQRAKSFTREHYAWEKIADVYYQEMKKVL